MATILVVTLSLSFITLVVGDTVKAIAAKQ